MKIVFATHNPNKKNEVAALLPNIELLSLESIQCHEDIEETEDTLEGNAKIKANYVTDNFQLNCFADDTGLEIEALNGEPGVYSARYAGENCSFEDNMNKLLSELDGKENRRLFIWSLLNIDELFPYDYRDAGILDEYTSLLDNSSTSYNDSKDMNRNFLEKS